jgi:hypothetical protein
LPHKERAIREGGEERDVFLGHQAQDFFGRFVAVLDRLHSGQDGSAHAFRRHDVGRDESTGAARLVHERLQLLDRERDGRAARPRR